MLNHHLLMMSHIILELPNFLLFHVFNGYVEWLANLPTHTQHEVGRRMSVQSALLTLVPPK